MAAACIAASTLSIAGAGSGSAQAANNFNLSTTPIMFGGYGSAKGSVAWSTAKRAVVTASVTDWCDDSAGDSRGAYLMARVTYGNGSTRAEVLWGDADGCNGSSPEPTYSHGVPNPDNRVVSTVVVRLCYNDGSPTSWTDCEKQDTSATYRSP
jgi:hypothetical protein